MNREAAIEKLMEFLESRGDDLSGKEIGEFLQKYPACREAWEEVQLIWDQFPGKEVPATSPELDVQFYRMLDEEQIKESKPGWLAQLKQILLPAQSGAVGRWALTLGVFIIGLVLGYGLHQQQSSTRQLDTLSQEMHQMKQMMMLTLLEQPSATERIKAVNISTEIERADDKVIEALFQTLNNDQNVNVRLVTAEALYEMADDPRVRSGLIRSIGQQDSPMVQLTLADIMIQLQEKQAIQPFQELLESSELDPAVKDKLEESLEILM